jgi:hypothetical protein
LHDGPCAVSEIENALGLRQPNLSQHLGLLRDVNLLSASRRAKSVVCELAPGLPFELITSIRTTIQSGSSSSARRSLASGQPAIDHSARQASAEPDDALLFAQVMARRAEN